MKFEVRTETFNITFVNNYVREKYQEMIDVVDELTDLPDEMREHFEDKKQVKRLQKRQGQLIRDIAQLRKDMLVEILTTNDYDYDEKFWMRKTDVDDVNNFVLDCIQKDVKAVSGESKKK